jgi:selenocysteine-specific elongation factor
MQLALPGTLSLSPLADVRLRSLPGQTVKHGARLMVHHFAAEVETRVSLLEDDHLSGSEGWAQLRLATPLPLVRGDRFVVRAGGETLGGGQVVDITLRRHRRRHGDTLQRLTALVGDGGSALVPILAQMEPCTVDALLQRAGPAASAELSTQVEAGNVIESDGWLLTRGRYQALTEAVARELSDYHAQHPLRPGISRPELRAKLGIESELALALIGRWSGEGILQSKGGVVARPGWRPTPTQAQEARLQHFLAALSAKPYAPEPPVIDADLAAYAEARGQAVRVGELYFSRAAYDEMTNTVVESARTAPVTLAQVRDRFGTTRRYAQALLEHLDQQRITRRVGDARVLRESPKKAATGS